MAQRNPVILSPYLVRRYLYEDERLQGVKHKIRREYDVAWFLYRYPGEAHTLDSLTAHAYDHELSCPTRTESGWVWQEVTKPQLETVRLILKRFIADGCEPWAPIRVEQVGKGVKGNPARWVAIVK